MNFGKITVVRGIRGGENSLLPGRRKDGTEYSSPVLVLRSSMAAPERKSIFLANSIY